MNRVRSVPLLALALLALSAGGCFGKDDSESRDGGVSDGGGTDDGGGTEDGGGGDDGGSGGCATPGERRCQNGTTAAVCTEELLWDAVPCASGTGCVGGLCLQQICAPGAERCVDGDTVLETCDSSGTRWERQVCPTPGACTATGCVTYACTPGESRCVSAAIEEVCAADGTGWVASACQGSEQCLATACLEPICPPGDSRCLDDATAEYCRTDGSGWDATVCPTPGACVADECVTYACTPGERRCAGSFAYELCAADGSGWATTACPSPQFCAPGGTCTDPVCSAGETRCADALTLETCRVDGSGWSAAACGANKVCSGNACLDSICTPFERRCVDADTAEVCSADGTGWSTDPCGSGAVCTGAGSCLPQICSPGSAGCYDDTTRGTCNADGTAWNPGAACPGSQVCSGGTCVADPCAAAAAEGSPAGCAFTTVITPGSGSGADQLVFGLANPGTASAMVTFVSPTGAVTQRSVGARSSSVQLMDLSPPAAGTGITTSAWEITSDHPVVLFQSTPRDTIEYVLCTDFLTCNLLRQGSCDGQSRCQTCDGSGNCTLHGAPAGHGVWTRVPPKHGLDDLYVIPGRRHLRYVVGGQTPSTENWPWSMTIAATQPGTTTVYVDVVAGTTAAGGTIGQAGPGQRLTVSLQQHESARIETRMSGSASCTTIATDTQVCSYPDTDLTGTVVTSTAPVAVQVGSMCGRAPVSKGGCDHVEEFVPPYAALGSVHVAGPNALASGTARENIFKVIATQDSTSVSFDPPTVGIGGTLDAGGYSELITSEPFVVSASGPVLVMKLATGRDHATSSLDPALEFLAPVSQWRTSGVLHVPDGYTTATGMDEAYLTVVTSTSATLQVGGATETLTAIGSSGYGWTVVNPAAGFHAISSTRPAAASLLAGAVGTSSLFQGLVSFGSGTSAVSGVRLTRTDAPDLP